MLTLVSTVLTLVLFVVCVCIRCQCFDISFIRSLLVQVANVFTLVSSVICLPKSHLNYISTSFLCNVLTVFSYVIC